MAGKTRRKRREQTEYFFDYSLLFIVLFLLLDVLSIYDKIPVCAAYELDGERIDSFPSGIVELDKAKPVYEYLPGWGCDISKCRRPEELPAAALDYIRYIEKAVRCPVKYVSVGPERDEYIEF